MLAALLYLTNALKPPIDVSKKIPLFIGFDKMLRLILWIVIHGFECHSVIVITFMWVQDDPIKRRTLYKETKQPTTRETMQPFRRIILVI